MAIDVNFKDVAITVDIVPDNEYKSDLSVPTLLSESGEEWIGLRSVIVFTY